MTNADDVRNPKEDARALGWNPIEHYKEIKVAEAYDAIRFKSLAGRIFDALEKWSVKRVFKDVPQGTHVIDCPCGTGRMAELLLDMGYHVTGVDISPAMLDVAKRKVSRFGGSFETLVTDARQLNSLGKSFGAALCARVLMHFPLSEQVEFLKGVASVTHGPIAFTQSYSSAYQRMRRRIKSVLSRHAPAFYPINEAELQELLRRAGLREVRRARAMPLISESVVVLAEKE